MRFKNTIIISSYFALYGLLWAVPKACAEYTSLVSADDFVGIRADVMATAVGIISILLVVVGLVMLVRALRG